MGVLGRMREVDEQEQEAGSRNWNWNRRVRE